MNAERGGGVHYLAFEFDLLFILDQQGSAKKQIGVEGRRTLYGEYHLAKRVLPL